MNLRIKYLKDNVEHITNVSDDFLTIELTTNSIEHKLTLIPKGELILKEVRLILPNNTNKGSMVFLNGYQSWTDSTLRTISEKMKGLTKLPKKLIDIYNFDRYGDYHIYDYKKHKCRIHGFTYGYIKTLSNYRLIGSLNDDKTYTIIEVTRKNIIIYADVNDLVIKKPILALNFIDITGTHEEVFSQYKAKLNYNSNKPLLNGYTSWYNHYQDISETIIKEDLKGLSNENYDLFQIDDGFETYVGDFMNIDKSKFPNGLKPIVDQIHEKHLLAGIWLAPFIAEEQSDLFKNHKELFAKNKQGNFIKAGSNWSGYYVLDFKKQAVKNYIKNTLYYYVNDLGFDFFKFDFLYAIGLLEVNDIPRATLQRDAIALLREALPNKIILGCGVQLASCFGLVDYCRIGPDVSLKFDDIWYMKFMHRERISTKITIQNTIFRRELDGIGFNNDPDVYLLRPNIPLNDKQKEALLIINHLFGSLLLTSDNIGDYTSKSRELLKKAKEINQVKVKDVIKKNNKINIITEKDTIEYDIKKGIIKIYGQQ